MRGYACSFRKSRGKTEGNIQPLSPKMVDGRWSYGADQNTVQRRRVQLWIPKTPSGLKVRVFALWVANS
jgi:hypothetical protein